MELVNCKTHKNARATRRSIDLGHTLGFASAQLAGRDDLGRASVIFSFGRPFTVRSAKIDSAQFSGSVPTGRVGPLPPGIEQVVVFTAASGTVRRVGGSIGETLILNALNGSPEAVGAAAQIGLLFGTPCEGVLALLAAAGHF